MQTLYNLTLHPQPALAGMAEQTGFAVEAQPRLRPVADPTDYAELKTAVLAAINGIPVGAAVLVGGLGQFQALIQDLGMFVIYFADYDPAARQMRGIVKHEPWTRAERFAVEHAAAHTSM